MRPRRRSKAVIRRFAIAHRLTQAKPTNLSSWNVVRFVFSCDETVDKGGKMKTLLIAVVATFALASDAIALNGCAPGTPTKIATGPNGTPLEVCLDGM
jgi:hypothetical protein